jgi:hypothetical protein
MKLKHFPRLGQSALALAQWLAPLGLCAMAALQPAQAQILFERDQNWTEAEVPPLPAYDTRDLIPVEGPAASSLKFGVDPKTISIGPDYVVRYVIVMQGPAAITAIYEGIRCQSGEKRVYARRNGDSPWETVKEEWQPLRQSSGSRYAWNMARDGVCIGVATNNSVRDIVNDLRSPKGTLYK